MNEQVRNALFQQIRQQTADSKHVAAIEERLADLEDDERTVELERFAAELAVQERSNDHNMSVFFLSGAIDAQQRTFAGWLRLTKYMLKEGSHPVELIGHILLQQQQEVQTTLQLVAQYIALRQKLCHLPALPPVAPSLDTVTERWAAIASTAYKDGALSPLVSVFQALREEQEAHQASAQQNSKQRVASLLRLLQGLKYAIFQWLEAEEAYTEIAEKQEVPVVQENMRIYALQCMQQVSRCWHQTASLLEELCRNINFTGASPVVGTAATPDQRGDEQ
jgi:hypothetical protein